MSDSQDIRWKQRFSNYQKALRQLDEFLESGELNRLEEQGLIQAFEYTYELAWNTLKDFLEYQGFSEIIGSRDTIRTAFSESILGDGHVWMRMIESRNKTAHTYNEATAREIVGDIKTSYHPAFHELEDILSKRLTPSP